MIKWILLIICIVLSITSCFKNTESVPTAYQVALYIANADGSNKQKVVDVGEVEYGEFSYVDVDYVKFIYSKNKLVYTLPDLNNENDAIYIVDIDGTGNIKISGDIDIKGTNLGYSPVSVSADGNLIVFTGFVSDQADLFMYDVDNETLVNVTETDNIREYNPKFSTDNETVCFITAIDTVHHLCILDIQTLSIDTIYTTNLRIPGCTYSIDNERIYFVEEADNLIKATLNSKDYFQANVISLNINTSEIIILDEDSANFGACLIENNINYVLYRRYSISDWVAYDLVNQNPVFIELYAGFVDLNEDNQILCSGTSIDGSIKLFNINTGSSEEIFTGSYGAFYNLDKTKICFVSRFELD